MRLRSKLGVAVALVCAFAAVVSQAAAAKKAPATGVWTQAAVSAATGNHDIQNVYAAPKSVKGKYVLGFINPNVGFPFFASWSQGYKAAAKLFGVKLYETDLGNFNFAEDVDKYNVIAVHHPQIVGTLDPSAEGLLKAVNKNHAILFPIDVPVPGDKYFWGVPNASAGAIGGKVLAQAVKRKWSGQNVMFVGLDQADTSTTVQRLHGAFAGYKKALGGSPSATYVDMGQSATATDGQRVMADFLTAHPGQKIAVVAENDESGGGALQAIQSANAQSNVLLVTLGGDNYGRSLFKTAGGVIAGEIDFNPYAEGFEWVEASLAILQHKTFKPYSVTRVLTRSNVNKYYPGSLK